MPINTDQNSFVILSEAKNLCTPQVSANCVSPSQQDAPLRMTNEESMHIRVNPRRRS
jgi:hypothetical protein